MASRMVSVLWLVESTPTRARSGRLRTSDLYPEATGGTFRVSGEGVGVCAAVRTAPAASTDMTRMNKYRCILCGLLFTQERARSGRKPPFHAAEKPRGEPADVLEKPQLGQI